MESKEMATAIKQVLDNINNALSNGMTVRIATAMQYTDVTSKTVAKFNKAGYDLFKVSGKSLYIRRGKNWDCIQTENRINSVKITAY
jgi:hypothetical protein